MSPTLKNAAWMMGQAFLQRLCGMFSGIVLARFLGPAALGVFNVVTTTASSAYGIARLGVDGALHVSLAELPESRERQSRRLLGAGLLLFLLIAILACAVVLIARNWLAQHVFGQPELAGWISAAAVLIVLQCLAQFCYCALVGRHEFSRYAQTMALSAIFSAAAIAVGAWLGGLPAAVAALVVAQLVTVIRLSLALPAFLREARAEFRLAQWCSDIRTLLAIGFPFYIAGLANVPATYWLQGLLAKTYGIDELGLLRVQMALVSLVSFIPTSVAAVAVSRLAQIRGAQATSADESLNKAGLLNIKLIWFVSMSVAIVLFTVSPWLVVVLYGQSYAAAVPAIRIACAGTVMASVVQAAMNNHFAEKGTMMVLALSTAQTLGILLVGTYAVPTAGLRGYAIAEAVGATTAYLVVVAVLLHRSAFNAVSLVRLVAMVVAPGLLVGAAFVSVDRGEMLAGAIALATFFFWGLDASERSSLARLLPAKRLSSSSALL